MRKTTAVAAVLTALVIAGLAMVAFRANQGNPSVAASGSSVPTSLVAVTRRDLTDRLDVNGTLGYGEAGSVPNHIGGTITWEAGLGSVVQRGQALFAVDVEPVILMYGSTPAYRDFRLGMSDGPDVRELELNLLALGYATSSNLHANGHFDWYDAAAVKRWQKAMGVT